VSGRGLAPAVRTPHPLIATLPGLYQDDPVTRQWMAALDEVLAPVFVTLDNLPAYLDPWLAPEDFLPWLAGWVGVALDPARPLGRRRAAVAHAVSLYRWRGTARGIAAAVELATGVLPEVRDSGGTAWSPTSGATPPGGAAPLLQVLLRVAPGTTPDLALVRQVVDLSAPAHVPVRIEVLTS
jgi:phage tail-like protein